MRRTIVFADPQALAPANITGSVALVRDLRALDTEASCDASQPNVAQRPLLGRAPLVGRRNLLLNTEDLSNPYWDGHATNTLVSDPAHGLATRIIGSVGSPDGIVPPGRGATGPRTMQAVLRAGSARRVQIGFGNFGFSSNNAGNSIIDLETMEVISTRITSGSAELTALGDGYALFTAVNHSDPTASPSQNRWVLTVVQDTDANPGSATRNDHDDVQVIRVQLEQSAQPTPYQRIGASDLDITEPVTGLPSPAFLRFDLSDDQLVHAFPEGFVGEVLIFGRNASWIAPDVTVAPGGMLTIGPQGIAGLPEAFLAHLGDIVGWVPIGKSLDAQARAALLTHYRPKGARPFVPALFEGASWNDAALWRDVVNITGAET